MELANELGTSLREFATRGAVEVRENGSSLCSGRLLAPRAPPSAERRFPTPWLFPHVQLQDAPRLVYLVAPALHFHPATDTLLRYLSRELEIVRVGLVESWRRGLRVVVRQ